MAPRESCINIYNSYASMSQKLNIELVDNVLRDNCDIISSANQLKQFSIKKNSFPLCDIDYILDYYQNKKNYIIKFMKQYLVKIIWKIIFIFIKF